MKSPPWKLAAGLLASMQFVYIGASELFQLFATGGIWVNFKSRGEPNNFQFITYADHPLNLIASLAIDVTLVVFGCTTFAFLARVIRKRFG
jgi:hypothetical protein